MGYKEYESIERVQTYYIKWTLGLERSTQNYLVHWETKRDKVTIKAGVRNFKEKIKAKEGESILKECVRKNRKNSQGEGKEREKIEMRKGAAINRRLYIEKNGWTEKDLARKRGEGEDAEEIIAGKKERISGKIGKNN